MLSNASEFNALGGGLAGSAGFGGVGYGGMGMGIPPVGLFGLFGGRGFGNDGEHHHGRDHGCEGTLFMMNQLSNVKDTIQNAKDSLDQRIDSSRDSLSDRLDNAKDALTSRVEGVKDEVCSLKDRICDAKDAIKDGFYATAIQAERNTTEIKNQATAFQIANDRKFEELSREGDRNTALILAKINQDTIDELREKLELSRRRVTDRELEINITNTNTNIQNQLQAQAQFQTQKSNDIDRKFDLLFNQLNKTSNDVFNWGVMAASGNQATQATNIK